MSGNNLMLEDLLKKLLHDRDDKKCDDLKDLLKKLPPNYPVGEVFLNGAQVPVATFSNVCDCLAYFTNDAGQVTVLNAKKVDGIAFGDAAD